MTLVLAFVAVPALPALSAACPASAPCPLMALMAETGPPCGDQVSGGSMDCCAGSEPGEPAEPEVSVAPESSPAGQAAVFGVAEIALEAGEGRAPVRPPDAGGPTLFLLHAVFRL